MQFVIEFTVNFGQNRVSLTIEFPEIAGGFNYHLGDEVRLICIGRHYMRIKCSLFSWLN